jgi:hypothetical protein
LGILCVSCTISPDENGRAQNEKNRPRLWTVQSDSLQLTKG